MKNRQLYSGVSIKTGVLVIGYLSKNKYGEAVIIKPINASMDDKGNIALSEKYAEEITLRTLRAT